MIDIILLIVCAVGTITSAVNATRANSFGGMLNWSLIGALELIATIFKAIQITT
jgi:hypothetical protein